MENLGIFYDNLVYFVVIWYISRRFGILYQEKSGNTGSSRLLALRICDST
jgi:hypothetical protein